MCLLPHAPPTTTHPSPPAVWDHMRIVARERYGLGQMPSWFNPKWLDIEEAPINTYYREAGRGAYEADAEAAKHSTVDVQLDDGGGFGGPGGSGSGGPGGSGGGGWWREDDPYWPLRDWGDHPMRWWTLAFAAVLAGAGGAPGRGGEGRARGGEGTI